MKIKLNVSYKNCKHFGFNFIHYVNLQNSNTKIDIWWRHETRPTQISLVPKNIRRKVEKRKGLCSNRQSETGKILSTGIPVLSAHTWNTYKRGEVHTVLPLLCEVPGQIELSRQFVIVRESMLQPCCCWLALFLVEIIVKIKWRVGQYRKTIAKQQQLPLKEEVTKSKREVDYNQCNLVLLNWNHDIAINNDKVSMESRTRGHTGTINFSKCPIVIIPCPIIIIIAPGREYWNFWQRIAKHEG